MANWKNQWFDTKYNIKNFYEITFLIISKICIKSRKIVCQISTYAYFNFRLNLKNVKHFYQFLLILFHIFLLKSINILFYIFIFVIYIINRLIIRAIKPTIFNTFVVSFVSFELNVFVAIFLASYIIITEIPRTINSIIINIILVILINFLPYVHF